MNFALRLAPTLLLLALPGLAQTTVTWTGSSSSDWDDPANWSPTQVPGSLDTAVIGVATTPPVASGGTKDVAVLQVLAGGSLTLSGAEVAASGDLDLDGSVSSVGATERLRCGGDLDVGSTGSYTAGAPLGLEGSGTMNVHFSTPGRPVVEVLGGTRTTMTCTVEGLILTGGSLLIPDLRTLSVAGDASFDGGVLSFDTTVGNFDTLDVAGDLIQTAGTIGTTSTQSRIYVAGDWLADSDFTLPNGWVFLDGGDSDIGGAAPAFHRVQLTSGVNSLLSDVTITGELMTISGTTTGSGWLEFNGSTAPHFGSNDLLHQVRIVGGFTQFRSSLIGELEVTGGTLHLTDLTTLTVQGDARLLGGTLGFDTTVGNFDTLDVAGDLIQTGTTVGTTSAQTRIYVAGDWLADTPFVLDQGWVYLDGGDSDIGGADPRFRRLWQQTGVNTLLTDVPIDGTLRTTTGTSTGAGWFEVSGTLEPINTSNKQVDRLRVVGPGTAEFSTSLLGELEVTGGTLFVRDNVTLSVSGDAAFLGGAVAFENVVGNLDTIDVAGSVTAVGGSVAQDTAFSRLRVAGDWIGSSSFVLPSGWVELDGPGTTSVSGPAPTFGNLRCLTGTRALLADTDVLGRLEVKNNTTLDVGAATLAVTGDLDSSSSGAVITGTAAIELVGTGVLKTHSEIPTVQVLAGTRTGSGATVAALELLGGTLHLADNSTLSVSGDAQLAAGVLSFDTVVGNPDTLDVVGDLVQTGTTVGSTSAQSRIFVAGDWLADTAFVLDEGWVYLDGVGGEIGGLAPAFKRLSLLAGVRDVLTRTEITGTVLSSGGSTTGAEWLEVLATTQSISTGSNTLGRLRVAGGSAPFSTTSVGEFELTGGSMLIQDNVTLSVSGDFRLLGGTLNFDTAVGNFDTIDIEGAFFQNGASLGTASDFLRIYCAGDWRSDTGFSLDKGWVYLDGLGDTLVEGLDPFVNSMRISNGKRTVVDGLKARGDVEVQTGATIELLSDLDVGSSLDTSAAGASIIGTGTIFLTADGYLRTNTTPLPPCVIPTGVREARNATVSSLTLVGGELNIADNSTLHVLGDLNLGSGSLGFDTTVGNFDTIDVDGSLIQSAVVITQTSPQSRIFCAGDWIADAPLELDQGWVFLDGGDADIGGPSPSFKRLQLTSGVKTVLTSATVSGTILSTGGSTAGGAYLVCTANVQPINTGSNLINRLRVASGTIPFQTSRIGELELVGGTLHVNDNVTVTVDGDARLLGGSLSFDTVVGNLDTLDVNGSLTESGTTAGPSSGFSRLRVAGDWTGDGSFVLSPGWTELDGALPSTIAGSTPTFGDLRVANGTRVLASDTAVLDDLEVTLAATLDVASRSLDVAGDLTSTASGASLIGDGPVLLSGTGSLKTNGLGMPHAEVTGGTRSSGVATVAALTVSAGSLHIADLGNLHVLGDAAFLGGSLSFDTTVGNFDTLDVDGALSQVGTTIGATSAQSRIFVGGDWSADGPFDLASGWVYLDGGDATIAGAAPGFKRLQLTSGDYTVASETAIRGTVVATGGSTSGPEWLVMLDNVQPVSTGSNLLGKVRVQAGLVGFNTSRLGELELTGGELLVRDNVTLTVDGDARLLAGVLSFENAVGNLDTLDVNGSVLHTATTAGTSSAQTRFRCAGDWRSNSSFALASGQVLLDGASPTVLAGSIPGNDPTFPTLVLTGGERVVESDTQLTATLVDVDAGARLTVTADALRPVGTAISVDGVLDVEAGARLAPDPGSTLTVNPSGRLELVGEPGNPAVLEGLPDGLACTVHGTLAARDFEVRAPAASGLVVGSGASLAPAPDDLRDGLFTHPAASPGSTLLNLDGSGGKVLPFLRFEDPLAVGTYNVRRSSGGTLTLANASGGFAGALFEDDAGGILDWTTLTTSVLGSFAAKGGPEKASLSWTSTNEAPGLSTWRLESAPSAAGPFTLLVEVAATGAGPYAYTHQPLVPDAEVHYRLFERQGGGLLNLLGEDAATPWSAAQPANVATVGPGGDFATIQAAVDAATGPAAVVSVAAGSYPSFSVLAPTAGQVHVIADGSGPVLVDATTQPVEIAFLAFGQAVELVGLEVTGGTTDVAVSVHDNLGSVLLDGVTVTGGAGQPGLDVASSLALSVGRCVLTGTPGLAVGPAAKAYIGRGSVDQLDVAAGGSVQLAGLIPGATNAAPGSAVVSHPGVMPDVDFGSFQHLGVPFAVDIDAAPASFYQLATSAGMFPLDLGDPGFWQMLLLVNFSNYAVITQGFTDASTGQVALTLELPADGSFVGAVLPLQAWTIAVVPSLEVRFSNLRTLVAMP